MLPVITAITYGGRTRQIAWAEETADIKDYGQARQITLFEHGRSPCRSSPLTSACPADILSWLKSRWREENFLKYASVNYGIDKICDYLATIEVNTKIVDNPARKAATAAVREAERTLPRRAGASRLLTPRDHSRRQERRHPRPAGQHHPRPPGSHRRHHGTQTHPRETARQRHRPRRQVALLRTGRRGLQMVLRLLAHNAEHWLSNQLNAYLRDDDEYRATTRQSIIRAWRHHHLHPRRDHRPPQQPRPPHRPRPALLIQRSTPPRPPCQATTAPSLTTSPRSPAFNFGAQGPVRLRTTGA